MVMSAKTPGPVVSQGDFGRTRHGRQRLAMFHSLLVNIRPRVGSMNHEDSESSFLFGPGGAMFLPADPSADVQPLQPLNQAQGLQASLSTAAVSSPLVFQLQPAASSLGSDDLSQPSTTPSTTHVLLTDAPSQTPTFSPFPISTVATQASNEPASTSQIQTQSVSESQTQAGSVTASLSSSTSSEATSAITTSSSIHSLTTSPALSSTSSTSSLQRDFEGLPRVAEIVIGLVGAISLIAFLATLGSWVYKQRHRDTEHAEITSITSFDNSPRSGFFGCLKKRSNRHTDDMSELGFGLGRITFFSDPTPGEQHHRIGLTRGAEHAMLEGGNRSKDAPPSPQDPFSDKFGVGLVDHGSSTVRPLPTYFHESGAVDGTSSISISPYQLLAQSSLGVLNTTPLTVTNFAPGDTNNNEGRHITAFLAPSSVTRYPSVGTPRIGVSDPRFMSLVEDEGLAVPWAPLNIRRDGLKSIREDRDTDLRDPENDQEQNTGVERLQISRASTLSLGMSRTFSQRLEHSLSKTVEWRDCVTRPPPGTFRAAWDEQRSADDTTMNATDKNWATTLKNNFYSALNAVGSSIHATSTGSSHVDLENAPENPTQSIQDKTIVPYNGYAETTKDPLEDTLTPLPAKVAVVRLGRTKGSILRGNLGIAPGSKIEHGTGLGLGLESLSRSSTLSTCWSETEKEPNEETIHRVRMRVRGLSRNSRMVQRSDTRSTASSMTHLVSRHISKSSQGRLGISGRSMKSPSQRPRYSRMPVSQSSMWSSTSFASTNGGEERC